MHYEWIIFVPVVFALGCASTPTHVRHAPPPLAATSPTPPTFPAAVPVKWVETRYAVQGYRETVSPDIRHEAHVVFRRTLVPLSAADALETLPRETFAPASIAPLPDNAELFAELNTQNEINRKLRDMKKAMDEMEAQMQARYAVLLKQGAEVMNLRNQLEAEHARLRALKQTQVNAPAAAPPVADNKEVRW